MSLLIFLFVINSNQMKKLAFFTENLSGGGVEKIQQIILKHLDYKELIITLYSLRDESQSAKQSFPQIPYYKYVFESILDSEKLTVKLLKKLKNRIRLFVYYNLSPQLFYRFFVRESYDIGIAFIEGYATRIVSGAPTHIKKIAWIHTELQKNHWTNVAFRNQKEERICYKSFQHIVCVSKEIKKQTDELFETHDKTMILYNPLDKKDIIVKSSYNISEKLPLIVHPLIVTLGRLEKEKGYARLLNVAKRLKDENLKFQLWIIGDGKEKDSLKRMVINYQLEHYVQLLGYKDNPYPYLKLCDFYVCSSFAEGYNTAITEALVLGKPVVSTDCSGTSEQLGDSQYGIITKNNEVSLYEGIRKMMIPDILKGYREQAEKRQHHFNLERQMYEIYQLLE